MPKIRFESVTAVSPEILSAYKAGNRSLGLPAVEPWKVGAAAHSLAVVGGSPDVADYLDELRVWDGDIFAINDTWQYLKDNGIDSILYTIDPVMQAPKGVERAVLGDCVSPSLIRDLEGADITLVKTGTDAILNFSTSAGTVPMFACWMGYKHVTFYGCGSSYGKETHAYKKPKHTTVLWVRCGGEEYRTSPNMLMQAEEMSQMLREFPAYLSVRGGGLLTALVEHGDYDVTHISADIQQALEDAQAKAAA